MDICKSTIENDLKDLHQEPFIGQQSMT